MKPIFLIRVPKELTPSSIEYQMGNIREELSDYHVLFVASNVEEYTFECFLATEEDKTIIERLTNELNEHQRRVG